MTGVTLIERGSADGRLWVETGISSTGPAVPYFVQVRLAPIGTGHGPVGFVQHRKLAASNTPIFANLGVPGDMELDGVALAFQHCDCGSDWEFPCKAVEFARKAIYASIYE